MPCSPVLVREGLPVIVAVCVLLRIAPACANEQLPAGVRAIFERRCLSCHNDVDRKGDFSLQTIGGLKASGHVIPGAAENSTLYDVLIAPKGQRPRMPPHGPPLTRDEVESVRQWLSAGAAWPAETVLKEPVVNQYDWWSLQPLLRPAIPRIAGDDAEWVRNPVDAFILEKLRAAGLSPSPEADRRTLIRRLSYDLTGLPATPAEIEAFLSDRDPRAYEHLVNRLLASPQAGEHWARLWLDVVRYADTCGYDKDKLRPNAWPYRDYVIRAFNNDKPYSQFVEEQLAGDVLFPKTTDGILGLGFIAAGPWDFIGHVEVSESKLDGQEARNLDRDEMVSATLNAFCSTTVQCARCHHHKFDPITQEQYYGLQAVFAAVDRADRVFDTDPETERQRGRLNQQLAKTAAALKSLDAEVRSESAGRLPELEKRLVELKARLRPQKKPDAFGAHSEVTNKRDETRWFQLDLGREVAVTRIVLHPCHDDFAQIGPGFGFPVRYRVEVTADPGAFVTGQLNSIHVIAQTVDDVPNPGLAAVEIAVPASAGPVRAIRVTGTRLRERQRDFALALAEIEVVDAAGVNMARGAAVTATDSIEAPPRWQLANLTDGLWPIAQDAAAAAEWSQLQNERQALRARLETPGRIARREALQKAQKELEQQRAALPAGQLVYAAATSFKPQGQFKPTNGQPRAIKVLHRGNVTQPRGDAIPGTIGLSADEESEFELAAHHSEGDRRAALARWISDRQNPLTWRSIANRLWQFSMGRGIVESPNDFGRMGQLPTHPELLDWLAVEFRDNGQSFRSLIRLIVLSSSYRQASIHSDEGERLDRSNQLLWKRDRRRLSAEEIRDSMLAVSGRLDRTMGGPAFQAFVLDKPEHSPHYEYDQFDPADPKSHRRSIYRFVVRSQPDPLMTVLDCADSSQSVPRRDETLTALQALSLLNSRFTLQMAADFGRRLERDQPELAGQVHLGFLLVTGRPPTDDELRPLEQYARQYGLPSCCRVLLNLSEFLYVD